MLFEMDLQNLASSYVSCYINWLTSNGIVLSSEEGYYLLDYSLNTIYEIPCSWYTESIINFGELCIAFLINCIQPVYNLNYESRVSLVTLAHSYFVATYMESIY